MAVAQMALGGQMALADEFIFIIGAHKAGTTSVAEWLGKHDDVSVAQSKEPNVFTTRTVDGGNDPYWDEFRIARIRVDASTNYAKCRIYPGTAERIRRFAPYAKIIYLTRDPLARLWSAWRQHLDESGYEIAADFRTAAATDAGLIDATLYFSQLAEYRRFFSCENIHTVPLELLTESETHQAALLDFVGLDNVGHELPLLNPSTTKGRDLAVVNRALRTTTGRQLADRLRNSPMRKPLATARRNFMLRPVDPAEESSRSWANVTNASAVQADCMLYLRSLEIGPEIWPSLDIAITRPDGETIEIDNGLDLDERTTG